MFVCLLCCWWATAIANTGELWHFDSQGFHVERTILCIRCCYATLLLLAALIDVQVPRQDLLRERVPGAWRILRKGWHQRDDALHRAANGS